MKTVTAPGPALRDSALPGLRLPATEFPDSPRVRKQCPPSSGTGRPLPLRSEGHTPVARADFHPGRPRKPRALCSAPLPAEESQGGPKIYSPQARGQKRDYVFLISA